MALCLFWFFCCCVRVLFRGGRREALELFGFEDFELEVTEAEVSGVCAPSAEGEGVSISTISADGDSEDMVAFIWSFDS